MTSTFTILCPQGIVMAADSRIECRGELFDGVQKIYQISKTSAGISYWRYVGFDNEKTVLEHLKDFEKDYVSETDTVDDVAEKMKGYLENINPKIKDAGGFHLAGCIAESEVESYRLRHVFHETWHEAGEFTNENCHTEYHDPYGNKITFRKTQLFPVLFNGDNFVANALFNYAPMVDNGFRIRTDLLPVEEAIDLSKLILETAVRRLTYYFGPNQRKALPTTGGRIFIAKITCKNGFEWIQPRQASKEKGIPIEKISMEELFERKGKATSESYFKPHVKPSSCSAYYASVDIFPMQPTDERDIQA